MDKHKTEIRYPNGIHNPLPNVTQFSDPELTNCKRRPPIRWELATL